jgi:hypothetical protein
LVSALDRTLAGYAVVIGTRVAYDVTLVEGQVVILEDLDHVPMPGPTPTPQAHARLGPDYRSRQDVIAGVAGLPIGAAAGLFASGIGDAVGVLAVQARDRVEACAVGERDLLEALLGEGEGPEFAGVGDGARRAL